MTGITIARLIVRGLVGEARALACRSYSVPESRAIAGACRHANRTFGTGLSLSQFLLR